MVNKALIGGIIGFILGGLVVSTAAVTMNRNEQKGNNPPISTAEHNKTATDELKSLKGDDFDEAFIKEMISHHQGAIDMAKLVGANAKHEELKELGDDIIAAQSQEIDMMEAWQVDWGYKNASNPHDMRGR